MHETKKAQHSGSVSDFGAVPWALPSYCPAMYWATTAQHSVLRDAVPAGSLGRPGKTGLSINFDVLRRVVTGHMPPTRLGTRPGELRRGVDYLR